MYKMTLFVKTCSSTGVDRFGNETHELSEPIAVKGCMFAPGAPQDLPIERPEGVKIKATAYLPRGWAEKLKRGQISADGKLWLDVVGEPYAYPCGMLPPLFPFDCVVPLKEQDG